MNLARLHQSFMGSHHLRRGNLLQAYVCSNTQMYKYWGSEKKKVTQGGWEPGRNKIMFVKHRKWVSLGRPD